MSKIHKEFFAYSLLILGLAITLLGGTFLLNAGLDMINQSSDEAVVFGFLLVCASVCTMIWLGMIHFDTFRIIYKHHRNPPTPTPDNESTGE